MTTNKLNKTELNQRRIPKQARALAKYNAVLEACTQVLAAYGYQKTTIMELSLSSGVAVPTIYQYFPNKEAIFVAWFDRIIDDLLDALTEQATSKPPADIERFIAGTLEQSLPTIELYRDSMRNLLADLPHLLLSHIIKSVNDKTTTAVTGIVSIYLGEEGAGLVRPKLQILMQCILGFVLQHVLIADSEPIDEVTIKELTELISRYLS